MSDSAIATAGCTVTYIAGIIQYPGAHLNPGDPSPFSAKWARIRRMRLDFLGGVEQRQLVGLITRRSAVRIRPPQPTLNTVQDDPVDPPPGVVPCPEAGGGRLAADLGSRQALDHRRELVDVADHDRADAETLAHGLELLDEAVDRADEDVRRVEQLVGGDRAAILETHGQFLRLAARVVGHDRLGRAWGRR